MSINKKLNEDYFRTKKIHKENNDKGRFYKSLVKRGLITILIFIIGALISRLF